MLLAARQTMLVEEPPAVDAWWLCFTAEQAGSTVSMAKQGSAPDLTLETSVNGGRSWVPFYVGTTVITLSRVGSKVYFRAGENGNSKLATSISDYNKFVLSGLVSASGNTNSLLDGDNKIEQLPADFCFARLFDSCSSLTTAPDLPASVITDGCYCTMFSNCTSLSSSPELPATQLKHLCYATMFSGCTSLITVGRIYATTSTGDYSCSNMFNNCKKLQSSPELNIKNITSYCFSKTFYGCSSLVSAGDILATSVEQNGCEFMFSGCISLIEPPKLPAKQISRKCYQAMFENCTSLVRSPALPATKLESYCYSSMFYECTSLSEALELSATSADRNSLYRMFYNCSSLVESPEIKITNLAQYCFNQMFYGCSKLNKITCHLTSFTTVSGTTNWVYGVADSGTFYCPSSLGTQETIQRGTRYCPENWTVVNI